MFWNKKEERDGLPDAPPMRSPFGGELGSPRAQAQDNYDDDSQPNSLPSFPDSPMNKGFSQSIIKDAVSSDQNEEEVVGEPSQERNFKTVEMEESPRVKNSPSPLPLQIMPKPFVPQAESSSLNLAPPPMMERSLMQEKYVPPVYNPPVRSNLPPSLAKNQDIFVKIEKFQTARRSLQAAQEQIDQMDELLRRIRDTKLREEQELAGWEKEISSLKGRVQNVTENIFEKIE